MTENEAQSATDATFSRAKPPILGAIVLVTVGLAIAGTVNPTVGGVVVVGAWVLGVFALHRLGRAGSLR